MYNLPYFIEPDEAVVLEFMRKNSFALITGSFNNLPAATHVPVDVQLINEKLILTGHIMKGTDHHKAFLHNENVLVIFTGPHCYVSASWYQKRNVASTWNYMDVHTTGKLKFTNDAGTWEIIKNITDKYEKAGSKAAFDKLPLDYVARLSKAIVGFHIEVESLQNVFKLSQNHDMEDRKLIIEELHKQNDYNSKEIANEMKKRL